MVEIIPAIMPKGYEHLDEMMSIFVGVAPLVQLDIMDGKFVPARTWPYPRDPHFDLISTEEEGMPRWEDINFEVDLMISSPTQAVPQWVRAGASRIIVHIESLKNTVEDFEVIRDAVPEGLIELGLAINTATPLSDIEPFLDRVDFVQCMGIARIGFQGEAFDPRVLEHVKALRALRPEMPISIDGSVNMQTARTLVDAGATRLVSGSAILEADDFTQAIADIKRLTENNA